MNKTWRSTKASGLLIALSLLCWTHVNAPNYNAVKSDDKVIYALFRDRFTEPIEVMYFLMNDMRLFRLTSNETDRIIVNMWELKEEFEQRGYKISDVIVIIHNHEKQTFFSPGDIDVYRLFKGEGFEGKFYIYVYRNKAIYELAERIR